MSLKKLLRFKQWAWLLLACLFQQVSFAALPDLGSAAQQSLSKQERTALKYAFLKALYDSHKVNTDPILNQWLTTLGQHLAQYAHLEEPPTFLLIDDPQINAFAGPGGVIGIHSGLILKAKSTDEIAAVIAHELGHVQQHHLLRRIHSSDNSQITALATLLAAILIGQQNPQAGIAAFYAGNGFNLQQQLAYSRTHETEADAVGIEILAQAGFDPEAMASFFGKLSRMNTLDGHTIPEILRTHPTSPHRMAAAENRAHLLQARYIKKPLLESSYLPYIQALISPTLARAPKQRCFLKRLKTPTSPGCSIDVSGWLGALLATPENNRQTIIQLLDRYPENVAVHLTTAPHLPDNLLIPRLKKLIHTPAPLRTLVLKTLSQHLAETAPDESKLYTAWARFEQGHWQLAKYLIKEIDHNKLSPSARLSLQALEKQTKTLGGKPVSPKKNLFSH